MSVSKSVKLYASFRLNHPTMENLFPGLSRFSSAPESALKSNNLQDTANAASKTASTPTEEEWTEVVHAEGGVYYWNQRTGNVMLLILLVLWSNKCRKYRNVCSSTALYGRSGMQNSKQIIFHCTGPAKAAWTLDETYSWS